MSDTNIKKGLNGKYFVKDNTFFDVAKTNPKDFIEKEIGDSKTPGKFLPQQKVARWDNEVNVSFRLVHDEKTPDVVVEGDDVVWKGKKVEARFYDVFNDEHKEGASEFEIILKERPATNVVEFSLNTKGLDFFYQPALTLEEIAEGSERPENVIGSYAVYASEQKNNYVDGKEYKTGKVGHIFRPQVEDANGIKVWGELNVDTINGILSVTIPQDFLDNAVYPVRHAAGLTFGYTTQGGTTVALNADNAAGSFINSTLASSGTVDSVSYYVSAFGAAAKGFIVENTGLTILANGVTASGGTPTVTGWKTISFSTPPSVTGGSAYSVWVVETTGGANLRRDAGSSGDSKTDSTNSFTTPTNPTDAVDSSLKYSIYATYTASGSTSPSLSPSISPSPSPSQSPSASLSPSKSPSISPSQSPSASLSPSISPSPSPSQSPSASLSPSISPSSSPSQSPSASLSPSVSPSSSPSQSPSASLSPSISPSISPSQSPSASLSPSFSPSISPSQSPSASLSPSVSPSSSPSQSPSASLSPSISPSISPSQSPSASISPSVSPSIVSSSSPSLSPSLSPSISPSQSPSASLSPSQSPSSSPSQSPSASLSPSRSPSISPSQSPSASLSPSLSPSVSQSVSSSASPSASLSPSISPSNVQTGWVSKPMYYWDGETWQEIDTTGV